MKKILFITLLFVCMGTLAFSQSYGISNMDSEATSVLKNYDGQFVGKTAALGILAEELQTILSSVPANTTEEITNSLSFTLGRTAMKHIDEGQEVLPALIAAYSVTLAQESNFTGNVQAIDVLDHFADLLSL